MKTLMKSFIMLFVAVILFSAGFIACRQDRLGDLSPTSSSVSVDRKELTSFLQKIYDIRYQSLYSRVDSSIVKQKLSGYFEPRALLQFANTYDFNMQHALGGIDTKYIDGKTKVFDIKIDSISSYIGGQYRVSISVFNSEVYASDNSITSSRDAYDLIIQYDVDKPIKITSEYKHPGLGDPGYFEALNIQQKAAGTLPMTQEYINQSMGLNPDGSPKKTSKSNAKVAAGTYVPSAATSYALSFCYNHNSAYPYYLNENCTNFISQCLKARGWQDVGNITNRTTSSAWFYGSLYRSNSWVNAQAFYDFANNNSSRIGPVKVEKYAVGPYIDGCKVGDIIQADWYKKNANGITSADGIIDHTMIVMAVNSQDVTLAYNSNDEISKKFSKVIVDNPGSKYYLWKVVGTNGLI